MEEINKVAGTSHGEAKNWCSQLNGAEDHQCIKILQKLALTDQINASTISYVSSFYGKFY